MDYDIHYCVFYMLDHERKIVNITRVLYGRRDLETVLAKEEQKNR